MDKNKEPIPNFHSDEEAERFVDECGISEYDLSSFKPLSSYAFAKRKDTNHD